MKLKYLVIVFCAAVLAACDVRIDSPTEPSKDKGVVVITPTPLPSQIVINFFVAEPSTISPNGVTVLRWGVSGPLGTVCRLEPSVGDVPTAGFVTLNLLSTTTFNLSCHVGGQFPTNRQLQVTVIK